MNRSIFIFQLLITTGVSLIVVGLVNFLLGDNGDWAISGIALLFFSAFCILMYFLGMRAMKSDNKYQFIRLVWINMMGKIFMSFIIVGIYYQLAQPSSKFFILPFLTIYLVYSVFETYFMIKQSNHKKEPISKK